LTDPKENLMRNNESVRHISGPDLSKFDLGAVRMPRHFLLGLILIFALLAFEAFNFDTTRYALQNLLGDVRFAGLAWATILAIAFCAIDFAGLGRLFTPERGMNEPKEIWYLTGAWLLGATMNAVMTWWAVSTVLLSHDLGNEVLSREQLLHIVPVFVAVLVWLTRILFIGAITMAGERLLHGSGSAGTVTRKSTPTPGRPATRQQPAYATQGSPASTGMQASSAETGETVRASAYSNTKPTRVSRRPPRPGSKTVKSPAYTGLQASGRQRR
jgi:hypothetical protein